jgi:hypothetical protein
LWRFDTRSDYERVQRYIQSRKFHATLPKKLDNAVNDYLSSIPEPDPELDWKLEEVGEFGEEGWTISYTHKSVSKNND